MFEAVLAWESIQPYLRIFPWALRPLSAMLEPDTLLRLWGKPFVNNGIEPCLKFMAKVVESLNMLHRGINLAEAVRAFKGGDAASGPWLDDGVALHAVAMQLRGDWKWQCVSCFKGDFDLSCKCDCVDIRSCTV